MLEKCEWDVKFGNNTIHAIGYDKRGIRGIFGVPVAEKRNGYYISVSVIAIERGYIDLHNTHYGLTWINPEERRILEKLGCTISPAEFVIIE